MRVIKNDAAVHGVTTGNDRLVRVYLAIEVARTRPQLRAKMPAARCGRPCGEQRELYTKVSGIRPNHGELNTLATAVSAVKAAR